MATGVLVQDCHRVSWVVLGLGDGYGVRVRDREPGHLGAFAGNPGHPCIISEWVLVAFVWFP